ncbi:MAG TPA: PorV/PorQ family protein [Candidatus Cloacimonadota bacterium]|nr:PorV/PorQ family protein [Candidatus Cloacimonadota bacterium]
MLKRLKRPYLLCWALSFLLLSPLAAINEDAGTTGFGPLKITMAARAEALAGAQMGLVQNPEGMQFNPASIIRLSSSEISTTYINHFVDTQGGALQAVYAKDPFIAWGFMLKYMNFGSMERTEISPGGDMIETGETFGAQNLIASVSMARFVSPMIDLGGSVKMVYDQIDGQSASAVMLDAGLIHHPANQKIKVGVGFRNLGFQLSSYTESSYKESLPFTFAGGITYQPNDKLLGSFDISKSTGENLVGALGAEYRLYPSFSLRGGYRTDGRDGDVGGDWGWSSGLSLGAGWSWNNYNLSYSLSSSGDLGMVNQLSLNYKF